MDRSRKFSKDSRSETEKVDALCDIFVGDYAVDRDVIEAVLDGCDGDVNKATENLLEMVSTAKKSKKRLEKGEENDLAVIACSILSGESPTSDIDGQSRKSQHSTVKKRRKPPKPVDNIQMAHDIPSDRGHDHVNEGTSFNDSNTTSYNFYNSSVNDKPRSEAKFLFKSEGHSQEFLAKSSFEDMARNMEQNAFVGSKTLGRPLEKEDSYLSVEEGRDSNLPSLKFDLSAVSFSSFQGDLKNVDCVNDAEGNKCSFPHAFDSHPCDPASSLITSNISPDVSAEWNAFYKELNLEPIPKSPASPDLDISQMVDNSAPSDCEKSFVSAKSVKQNIYVSKESGGDTIRERNDSQLGNINYNVSGGGEMYNLLGTDFLSLPSQDEERNRKIKPNNTELKLTLKNHSDSRNKSLFSNEASSLSLSHQNMAVTMRQSSDNPRLPASDLSPTAPAFTPARTRYSNMISQQQSKAAVTPPLPLKLLKVSKRKNMKKTRKQQQPAQCLNEISHQPSHDSHKILEQHSRIVEKNPDKVYCSSTNEVDNGLYDPFGWGEIRDITSSSSSLPAKPQPQRINKTRASHSNASSNQIVASTMSLREDDIKTGPSFVEGNSPRSGEHTALDKPSCPSNPSAVNSQNGSTLPLVSRLWKSPLPHQNAGNTTTQSFKGAEGIEIKNSKHVSSRLPPSLAMHPPILPPSSPLLSSTPSKVPAESPPMIEKNTSLSRAQHTYRNKVQLVGVKTPVGMLRHYIQQGHPLMVILRGLPGSGKSYLARQLMVEIQKANKKGVILSTDDYFVRSGEYSFDRNHLGLAHDWNKQRALSSVKEKQHFVIIDNTNTTMWELLPYAKMAVQYQYDMRICEPDTPWKNKLQELMRKNEHGLSKEHIKRMKERYEPLTTEEVLQEAYKSLVATGRLRPMGEDKTEKIPQLSKDKLENRSPSDEIVANEAIKARIGDSNKDSVNPAVILSDVTLTGWMPPQEQRKQSLRSRKDLKPVDSSKSCAKLVGPQITLDFLNNSLKKAMVDIDKMARDSQPKKDRALEEMSFNRRPSSNSSSAIEDVQTKDKSLSINFGHVSGQNVDLSDEPDDEQHDKPNSENDIKITESSLNKVKDDFIASEMRMSNTDEDDTIGGFISSVSPRESSPVSSQHEEFSSPRLTSSWTSGSFHSCKSDEEEAVASEGIEDVDSCIVGSTKFPGINVNGLSEKDSLDSQSDVTTPVNIVETIIFSSADERNLESKPEKLFGVDIKSKEQTDHCNLPSEMTNNSDCAVHRLPSFTGSLVQYDDSEEESEDEHSSRTLAVESGEPVKKAEDESFNSVPSLFSDKDDTHAFVNNLDGEKIKIHEDGTPVYDKVKATDESVVKCTSCDSASASLTSSREQSPHTSADMVNGSPEKAKKKRIRKGRNPAPFLEDFLVTESKSRNWHSFFNQGSVESNHQLVEEMVSSPTESRVVDMTSVGVQCEPFYFTMVYRLNSKAFSQEPVDLPLDDVSVLQISDQRIDHISDEDLAEMKVTRRHNMSDQSTMTDETLDAEKIDLLILQNCFPAFSRNYLEEVMSVCGNNLEWVTSHLIDSPPLIDVDDEEETVSPQREEDAEKSPQKSDFAQASSAMHHSIKSLAHLASDVVKDIAKVDPDDLEIEVIKAGQKRLLLIENFGKERLHSISHESVKSDDWSNDFCHNYFSGPLTPEECWEWNPSQDVQGRLSNSLFPISPSSPTDSGRWRFQGPPVLSNYGTNQYPVVDFCGSLTKEHRASVYSHEAPMRFSSSPSEIDWRLVPGTVGKEQHQQLAGSSGEEEGNVDHTMTQPLLPLSFIRCLENLYGPLNVDLDNEGLLLEDRIARKIFNCLKLQTTKSLRHPHNDEQLKEDEALARALQEEENARIHSSVSKPVPKPGQGENKTASQRRVNSVSNTLHYLRGTTPRQLKPYKFLTRGTKAQAHSVWENSFKQRPTSDLHSIIAEEKAREEHHEKQMQLLRATGDADALATKLKRQELHRKYPLVEPGLLEEIFINNNYSLEATEKSLELQYDMKSVTESKEAEQARLQEALQLSQAEHYHNTKSYPAQRGFQDWSVGVEALSYDDLRCEAQIYRELANECQQKAQRYQREGMPSAGLFYRQEAKKYKAEEESANGRAASCLFEKGSERLKKSNTLDLHSFHLDEAIKAVNTAIEMKREEYRQKPDRKKSYLNIITGRGQNSKGGVARLKPAVINHLRDRNFKFEEETAGMLKVYIFPTD